MQHSEKTTKLYSGRGSQALKTTNAAAQKAFPMGGTTQVQKDQIKTWAEQRDGLLKDIAIHSDSFNALTAKNKALAETNTDLTRRNSEITGSIAVMEKVEEERSLLTSQDLAKKLITKSQLEGTIAVLETKVKNLEEKKATLHTDIATAISLHDRVFARASVLDQVVDRVTRINKDNITDINMLISDLKKILKDNLPQGAK